MLFLGRISMLYPKAVWSAFNKNLSETDKKINNLNGKIEKYSDSRLHFALKQRAVLDQLYGTNLFSFFFSKVKKSKFMNLSKQEKELEKEKQKLINEMFKLKKERCVFASPLCLQRPSLQRPETTKSEKNYQKQLLQENIDDVGQDKLSNAFLQYSALKWQINKFSLVKMIFNREKHMEELQKYDEEIKKLEEEEQVLNEETKKYKEKLQEFEK